MCPPSICRPWRGRPSSSRLSLGDPSRVDFRLVFYPLVTPLRRDDQGLSSDEASGFNSCAACDWHLLISNEPIWGKKKIKAFGLHIPSQTHLEHRRVDLTANPSSYNVKCRGMNYILLMIPCFVELMNSTIFRISGLSGTCSLICNTASNTLFWPWNTKR